MSAPAPTFDPSGDAAALRKAMKGLGTNDKVLVEILTNRTNEQIQIIREIYQKEIQRDLVSDVKSETSGEYETALVGILLTPAEWDAKCLRSFMKGAGTDEEGLIQHLTHRTGTELDAIKEAYLRMYGSTLQHHLEGDTSGFTRKFFVALINSPRKEGHVDYYEIENDVNSLYYSGQGKWGTDEAAFIQIITKHGNDYLKALNLAYARRYGDSLVKAVRKEMSGWLAAGLEAMLVDHDEYYARLIHEAVDGVGTKDNLLIRAVTSRRSRLTGINDRFIVIEGKNLHHRLETELSGNYRKVLMGITKAV